MSAAVLLKHPDPDHDRLHVLIEGRHLRSRLALAMNDIDYAMGCLSRGWITADAALELIEEALDKYLRREADL